MVTLFDFLNIITIFPHGLSRRHEKTISMSLPNKKIEALFPCHWAGMAGSLSLVCGKGSR